MARGPVSAAAQPLQLALDELSRALGRQLERALLHPEARLSDADRRLLIDWSVSAGGWDRLEERLPRGGRP